MNTSMEFSLQKWVWTEHDYDEMGWNKCTVHALGFLPVKYEFALDIDYIFEWVEPQENRYYKFWVAPATLVFRNVSDLNIQLELVEGLQLEEVKRRRRRTPSNAAYIPEQVEWKWTLASDIGRIGLWSVGYHLFVRMPPILSQSPSLSLEARGGLSLERSSSSAT